MSSAVIPTYNYEDAAQKCGYQRVAGVDEVGRGPLAGPVVAAAVVLDLNRCPKGLNDSKKLTAKARGLLYKGIWDAGQVSIGQASVEEIDDINILQASHLAMIRAVSGLELSPDYVLIDGNKIPKGLSYPAEAIVKGDQKSLSIAAASIVAKVFRDRLMCDLAKVYPNYGWDKNAGYPTAAHKEGLKCHGVTPHHRRSFRPIHNILWQDENLKK